MKGTLLLALPLVMTALMSGRPALDPPAGNPFFSAYTTPFGVPPFDQIKPEHFEPAIDEGIKQQTAEIATITQQKAAPTFANTVEALEASGDLLRRVNTVLGDGGGR